MASSAPPPLARALARRRAPPHPPTSDCTIAPRSCAGGVPTGEPQKASHQATPARATTKTTRRPPLSTLTSSPHAAPPSPSSDRARRANGRARATGEEATGETATARRAVVRRGGGGRMGHAVAGAGGSLGGGQHARRPSSVSMELARWLASRIRRGEGGNPAAKVQANPGRRGRRRRGAGINARSGCRHACVPPAAEGARVCCRPRGRRGREGQHAGVLHKGAGE